MCAVGRRARSDVALRYTLVARYPSDNETRIMIGNFLVSSFEDFSHHTNQSSNMNFFFLPSRKLSFFFWGFSYLISIASTTEREKEGNSNCHHMPCQVQEPSSIKCPYHIDSVQPAGTSDLKPRRFRRTNPACPSSQIIIQV